MTTPPSIAIAPPESPVPAPRGTKGTPKRRQTRTHARHLVGVAWQDDGDRNGAVQRETVTFVGKELLWPRQAVDVADDAAQRGDEAHRSRLAHAMPSRSRSSSSSPR